MQRICVFCGSNRGTQPAYALAAEALGDELVKRGLGLVYGGASVGLMGILADRVLAGGGEVIGVMPQALVSREVGHRGLTAFHEVESMHERKAMMADLADGFIAMPGGFGTLDELFEILTWTQLGLHQKPVGVLNSRGYFDLLFRFLQHAAREGFMPLAHLEILLYAEEVNQLLELVTTYTPVSVSRWADLPER